VVLYEKAAELGGQVLVAGKAPLRPGYGDAAKWLARQLARTSAEVRRGTEATLETVLAERPDAVVVATGAVPRRPDLPGVELPGVATVEDVLLGRIDGGRRCVVVDATGRIQAGLAADALARQGRAVTIVTPYHTVCDQTEPSTREPLYERLYGGDVTMVPDTGLVAIEPTGDAGRLRVLVRNEYSGRRAALEPVDLVVLSCGASAVDDLYRALAGKVPELALVGDAMAPRLLHDAILEATRVARRI
jgi:pyruvate/2-oxoglutarate dehydrogenase complex dihydrolipoamide dehydrogenase (E3) component